MQGALAPCRHLPRRRRAPTSNAGESGVLFILSPAPPFPLLAAGHRTRRRRRRCPCAGLGIGLDRPYGRLARAPARPSAQLGPASRSAASGTSPAWPRPGPALRPAGSATGPACKPTWADLWAGPNSKICYLFFFIKIIEIYLNNVPNLTNQIPKCSEKQTLCVRSFVIVL